jgi:phospholipid/cholesterol/gamma-HCH transport system substrate-binding protein
VTYRNNIEQLLVLLPQGTAAMQAINLPNRGTKQDYKGAFLSFNLNLNVPPVCNTGFLPTQQVRSNAFEDSPDRIEGDLYCRVPQDSTNNVRGARNTPCVTRPGKRAPTVKMCESDQNYVPLNDGFNWKGDPNATLSGQGVPQLSPEVPSGAVPLPGAPPPLPAATSSGGPLPIATAEYDPATGTYVGPDGNVYTQSDLAHDATKDRKWQDMLLPPAPN